MNETEKHVTGLVVSTTNNISKILCEDGLERLCAIKGKRIKTLSGTYNSLAVGDVVEVVPTDGGKGLVESLSPRRNTFGRYNEKGKSEQAIAANVDQVFCVTSPRYPPFRPRFIDRVAVLAESAGVPFVVTLNKADFGIDEATEERLAGYASLGYTVLRVSAKTGEGMENISRLLSGRTSVFAGQSGVGKSSLLNALFPEVPRRTQEVSEKYDRGKHTTTMAEMTIAGTARVIDTPGIRRLALRSPGIEALPSCFPEIFRFSEGCRYGSRCTHTDEEGCAVREAALRGDIHEDRYESYLRIRDELDVPETWKKPGNRNPGRAERAFSARRKATGKFSLKDHDAEREDTW